MRRPRIILFVRSIKRTIFNIPREPAYTLSKDTKFLYIHGSYVRSYIHGIIMSGFGDISTVQFENWSRNVKLTRYALVTHE